VTLLNFDVRFTPESGHFEKEKGRLAAAHSTFCLVLQSPACAFRFLRQPWQNSKLADFVRTVLRFCTIDHRNAASTRSETKALTHADSAITCVISVVPIRSSAG
jgi:hypothetical protein